MVKSLNEPQSTAGEDSPPPVKAAVVVEDGTTEVLGETVPPTGVPPIETTDPTPPDPEAPVDQTGPAPHSVPDPDDDDDEVYSEAELNAMTRAELDKLATEHGLDPADYPNKAAIIEALMEVD